MPGDGRQASAASCGVVWVRISIGFAIIASVFSSMASRSANHATATRATMAFFRRRSAAVAY